MMGRYRVGDLMQLKVSDKIQENYRHFLPYIVVELALAHILWWCYTWKFKEIRGRIEAAPWSARTWVGWKPTRPPLWQEG